MYYQDPLCPNTHHSAKKHKHNKLLISFTQEEEKTDICLVLFDTHLLLGCGRIPIWIQRRRKAYYSITHLKNLSFLHSTDELQLLKETGYNIIVYCLCAHQRERKNKRKKRSKNGVVQFICPLIGRFVPSILPL